MSERLLPATTARSLFYAFGPQGETRELTSSTGQVVDSYTYTAWGQALTSSGSDANPFQYGGKVGYYSEYGGSVLCGHRWYDTGTLRWLSRDPIGYNGGSNLYTYCGDDPVSRIDPDGTGPSGEAIIWLIKLAEKNGIKYKQLIRPVNTDTAQKIRNAGGNILVRCQRPSKARKIAKGIEDAVPGNTIEHGPHNDPDIADPRPHFQTNGFNGHTFFSAFDTISMLLPMQFQAREYDPVQDRKNAQDALNNLKKIWKRMHH